MISMTRLLLPAVSLFGFVDFLILWGRPFQGGGSLGISVQSGLVWSVGVKLGVEFWIVFMVSSLFSTLMFCLIVRISALKEKE